MQRLTELRAALAWSISIAASLVILTLAGQPVAASKQPRARVAPTPIPTRNAGWFNSAAPTAPDALHRTAQLAATVSSDIRFPCAGVIVSRGSHAWAIAPTGLLSPGDTLAVQQCSKPIDDTATYTLTAPDGRVTSLTYSALGNVWTHRLAVAAPPGTYLLTFRSRFGIFTQKITVQEQAGPSLSIRDAGTGLVQWQFSRGRSLLIDYQGFAPRQRVEVGLYRSEIVATLIDSWQLMTDPAGTYREQIAIPPDAPVGIYYLFACSGDCTPYVDRGGILRLPVVYLGFSITDTPAGLEIDVNRPGQDYRSFSLPRAQPELCQQACLAEPRCRAFTYVNPGIQGAQARCWLKESVPPAVASDCCVSGTR